MGEALASLPAITAKRKTKKSNYSSNDDTNKNKKSAVYPAESSATSTKDSEVEAIGETPTQDNSLEEKTMPAKLIESASTVSAVVVDAAADTVAAVADAAADTAADMLSE